MTIPAARVFFPAEDIVNIQQTIGEILKSGRLTLGKCGEEFENRFASRAGVRYGVAVANGTCAIEIGLRIIGVQGKSVVVPTNTFYATAAAVVHAGGVPSFADCDESLCVTADTIEKALRPDTVAVIVVHIGGAIAPDMARIRALCSRRGLALMEDAAHAHGSTLNGAPAGSFSDMATFSFYPTKVMTSAEGGVLVTNDAAIAAKAKGLRDHGKESFTSNIHIDLGYNWRLSEVHAAIGLSQLDRLDEFIAGRRQAAAIFDAGLAGIPGMEKQTLAAENKSNYYKYIAFPPAGVNRLELKSRLRSDYNVSLSGEVYELPLHLQPVFKSLVPPDSAFPVAEDLCRRHICLPVSAVMTREEAEYVIDCLKKVV
jgi:dTDP-4-amino-4,6-dideoxygalactose transaminase